MGTDDIQHLDTFTLEQLVMGLMDEEDGKLFGLDPSQIIIPQSGDAGGAAAAQGPSAAAGPPFEESWSHTGSGGSPRLAGVAAQDVASTAADSPCLAAFPTSQATPAFSLDDQSSAATEAPQVLAVPEFGSSNALMEDSEMVDALTLLTTTSTAAPPAPAPAPPQPPVQPSIFTQFMPTHMIPNGVGVAPPGCHATALSGAADAQVTQGMPAAQAMPVSRVAPSLGAAQPPPADFDWHPSDCLVASDSIGRRVSREMMSSVTEQPKMTIELHPALLYWPDRQRWMWHKKWSLPVITVRVDQLALPVRRAEGRNRTAP